MFAESLNECMHVTNTREEEGDALDVNGRDRAGLWS